MVHREQIRRTMSEVRFEAFSEGAVAIVTTITVYELINPSGAFAGPR